MNKKASGKSISIHFIWPVAALVLLLALRGLLGGSQAEVGGEIYQNYCASCHGEEGKGFGELVPPLAGADFLAQNQDKLPCIILYGIEGPIEVNGITYNQPMAGLGFDELGLARLSHSQIQQLINFIQNSWGNKGAEVSRQQVNDWLKECSKPSF